MGNLNLATSLCHVLERFASSDIRPRDSTHQVWDLIHPPLLADIKGHRAQSLAECKRELLHSMIQSSDGAFLKHADDPTENGVPGEWQAVAPRTWRIPPDIDLDHPATSHWLFDLGNWQCYVCASPIDESRMDPARSSSEALLAWMAHARIQVLVDSFHDDVSWVVAIPRHEQNQSALK